MSREDSARSAAPQGVRRSVREGASDVPPIPLDFFARPAELVAKELLGCLIVSAIDGARCVSEIVETEAYVGPDDEASHAHRRFGITPRNQVMYGPPGLAYIYRIYGIHFCLNAVTDGDGFPAAVLIRAARPIDGIADMRRRRAGRSDRELLSGPGKLCQALGIDLSLNRHSLQSPPLWMERGSAVHHSTIATGPRIGITRSAEAPLRFWIRDNVWVSR
ncbi:DNA-3-methyladenine glycosylase [soil metagenome]